MYCISYGVLVWDGRSGFIFNLIFKVTGFSVKGLVVERSGGSPMQGAKILLDRKPAGVTEKDGKYTLSNLKVNSYTLQVIAGMLQ